MVVCPPNFATFFSFLCVKKGKKRCIYVAYKTYDVTEGLLNLNDWDTIAGCPEGIKYNAAPIWWFWIRSIAFWPQSFCHWNNTCFPFQMCHYVSFGDSLRLLSPLDLFLPNVNDHRHRLPLDPLAHLSTQRISSQVRRWVGKPHHENLLHKQTSSLHHVRRQR